MQQVKVEVKKELAFTYMQLLLKDERTSKCLVQVDTGYENSGCHLVIITGPPELSIGEQSMCFLYSGQILAILYLEKGL